MNWLAQVAAPGGGAGGGGGSSIPIFGGILMLLFVLLIIAAAVSLWGLIFSKAGYSFWFGLLMLVPIGNFIWLLIFAFSKWPIQQEVEMLRQRAGFGAGGAGGFGPSGFPVGPPADGGYAPPQAGATGGHSTPPPPPRQ